MRVIRIKSVSHRDLLYEQFFFTQKSCHRQATTVWEKFSNC